MKKLKEVQRPHACCKYVQSKSRISTADLAKLKSPKAFDLNNLQQLQEKVFFDIQTHFKVGDRYSIRALKKTSLQLKFDYSCGREFFVMQNASGRVDSVSSGESVCSSAEPRLYATGAETCPVFSLKKYLDKLNQDYDALYQMPTASSCFNKPHGLDHNWYTRRPVGKNTLGQFMKNISKRLNLSVSYSNYSIYG